MVVVEVVVVLCVLVGMFLYIMVLVFERKLVQ